MKSHFSLWAALFVLGQGVLCHKAFLQTKAIQQPKDAWDTETWGGLPLFIEQEESDLWDLPALDHQPRLLLPGVVSLPNPCTETTFAAPVYEYHQWNLRKTYLSSTGEYPVRYQLAVTLRDIANNYSMQWRINCAPETDFQDDRFQGQVSLSMWLRIFEVDWLTYEPLSVTQYWYCPPGVNASSYPRDCADMSLTHPDWVVENGTIYVPGPSWGLINQTTLNFTLTSRATGVQHFCRWGGRNLELVYGDELLMVCSPLPGAPYDASGTSFRVKFGYSNRELNVQQNWTCGDTKGTYSRKFQANEISRYKMPLFCADDAGRVCRANRQVIKGQLTAPVSPFTPATIPPPPGATQPGCTARSGIPTWLLHFRFEETRYGRAAGNQQVPSSWRQPTRILTLQLRNDANNYTQTCTITTSDDPAILAKTWRRCFPDTSLAQRYIETYFKFNQTTAQLQINQTWFCSDTDPSQPLLYQATLSYKIPLCGETNTTAPGNWPQCRDFYQTRWCDMATYRNNQLYPFNRTVGGTVLRTERLPANALTDPDPDPNQWACTADSLARPVEWRLRSPPTGTPGQIFSTTWPSSYSTAIEPRSTFAIELNNSALSPRGSISPGYTYGLEDTPNLITSQRGRPFRNVVNWSFRFDASSGYLELKHSWFCNDKNPDTPILFNGTWAGYLALDLADKLKIELLWG
ncbi:hypothetical protein B0H63DRAFT_552312 [Podospora didyma]|uniref:Uncharacterized protein n=1 Tax=Podospora didyma TaxID=330526 RepID=A0AAE0N4E0_9PEZI|nr:hypothetical protein B0H63DRAFT_552312 [Podospora didyma]